MNLTNYTGISLPLAVWLAADGYDFTPGTERAISATSLLRPVRQILLKERLDETTELPTDVADLIPSRLGHTIHDGIEKAWKHDFRDSMRKLGYPEDMVQRVAVNPEFVTEKTIPIWIEQRSSRIHRGYKISGKFDMVVEGELHDFKSTSTFAFKGGKDEDYRLQGSIYRWLNPEKITGDVLTIHFIFTDWMKGQARANPDYPQQRLMSHPVQLYPLEVIQKWIDDKLDALEAAADLPENEIPYCTDKELWRDAPVWKYFSDPAKANTPGARSSKNFDNAAEAQAHMRDKGGKGVILEVAGKVKACGYCPAFPICSQKDLYDHG
jgi:hypothetical protein